MVCVAWHAVQGQQPAPHCVECDVAFFRTPRETYAVLALSGNRKQHRIEHRQVRQRAGDQLQAGQSRSRAWPAQPGK